MFAERSQYDEALIDQIGDRMRDADVTLVLGVVGSHNRQNTRLPVRRQVQLALVASVAQLDRASHF